MQEIINNDQTTGLFKGQFIGMKDMDGNDLHEGNKVSFYYKGQWVKCTIVYSVDTAMFCLRWPDGYVNKWPLNPEKYKLVE